MDKKKFNIDSISLVEMGIINAAIENKTDKLDLEKGETLFNLTYQFNFSVNESLKRLRLIFVCSLAALEKEKKTPIDITARFEIAFIFNIENYEDLIGENNLPNLEMGVALTNIAYSTSRGIIFTRCQGTVLKNWILPILPTEEIKKFHSQTISLKS